MGNEEKWKPGDPASQEGTQESYGATAAFGMVRPGAAPGPNPASSFEDDLLSLLSGGTKKHSAPAVPSAPAAQVSGEPVSGAPVSFPPGPVVHEVAPPASGSENQDDILNRLRAAVASVPFPAPAQNAFASSPQSAAAPPVQPQQPPQPAQHSAPPGVFTQMLRTMGPSSQANAGQANPGQANPGAGGTPASLSAAPATGSSSGSSSGFTELFGKVSTPQAAPVVPAAREPEPLFPPVAGQPVAQPASQPGSFTQIFGSFGGAAAHPAREPEPVFPPAAAQPAPQPAPQPASQPGSFTQAFGSYGGAASLTPAAPPVTPVVPASAPEPGGFTALFGTKSAEPVREKTSAFSFSPEAATGVHRQSATESFNAFGGAGASHATPATPPTPHTPPTPPTQATPPTHGSATASFSMPQPSAAQPQAASSFSSLFPAIPAAPAAPSSGGFTELFSRVPAEERERALSSSPAPGTPQPSLTQMFGSLNNAPSAPAAPPSDPSSFTQILSRSASAPPQPSAPWEPSREAASGLGSRPEPVAGSGFGVAPSGPPSDPSMNVSVTRLLSRLDSAPVSSSAPASPAHLPAPSGDSWTKTFETLSSPSSPAPASSSFGGSGGGYAPAPLSGGEATRAMAIPGNQGFGSNAPPQAAPEPSGPSEVTRIINASKMRESALRSGGGAQDQPAAAVAPQPTGGAPGMPAMPGGMKFTPPQMQAPQMNPQAMMHAGGMGAAGQAAPGMGAGGGMHMPHMQMPQMQAPQMNMPPAGAAPAAPAAAQATPNKLQQMIPLLLVAIIFLLVALLVTVIFMMKH